MMRIAFYAPLKSPLHPVPSGDRRIARGFLEALRLAGHDVDIAAHFRSWEGGGSRSRQILLRRVGEGLAKSLCAYFHRHAPEEQPQLWFTYHLYHKAPDWLGPVVAEQLHIPYVVAEASHALSQCGGLWAEGYEASLRAIQAASAIISLNRSDLPGLSDLVPASRLYSLKPFINLAVWAAHTPKNSLRIKLATRHALLPDRCWLLTVAMMRPGRKVKCFHLLAQALLRLKSCPWQLIVVGEGRAREQVENLFPSSIRHRVVFVGGLDAARLMDYYHASDAFVWPAIDEPLGMTFLEAQALGLPVVAGHTRGVPDMVADEVSGILVAENDADAFAKALQRLLDNRALRETLSFNARAYVLGEHHLPLAAKRLNAVLNTIMDGYH